LGKVLKRGRRKLNKKKTAGKKNVIQSGQTPLYVRLGKG